MRDICFVNRGIIFDLSITHDCGLNTMQDKIAAFSDSISSRFGRSLFFLFFFLRGEWVGFANQRVDVSVVCFNITTSSLEAEIRDTPYLINKSRADVG